MQNDNYNVGTHGNVRLVESLGNDASIVQAARVSTGKGTKGSFADEKLIRYLLKHGHGTPFEMVQFKFHIKCPFFIQAQWNRHRIGSFNQISGRYTRLERQFEYPSDWREQGRYEMQSSSKLLPVAAQNVLDDAYLRVIAASNCFAQVAKELGCAREMSRYADLQSQYTEFYWSVNLRSLMNFLLLRTASGAQAEMQEYATAVQLLTENVVPYVYSLITEGAENEAN